jgi:hypothetical protein
MSNRVVAHYADGRILKGECNDFFPGRPLFHLKDATTDEITEIQIGDLKGVFFVKSLTGNKAYNDQTDVERPGFGKRIRVRFKDGEIIQGYTSGYSEERPAFFLFPADPDSNNDKIFVVSAETTEVVFA